MEQKRTIYVANGRDDDFDQVGVTEKPYSSDREAIEHAWGPMRVDDVAIVINHDSQKAAIYRVPPSPALVEVTVGELLG